MWKLYSCTSFKRLFESILTWEMLTLEKKKTKKNGMETSLKRNFIPLKKFMKIL